jgi:hypothetical protein
MGMAGRAKAIRVTLTVAAIALLLNVPAHSEGKKGGRGGPPTENRPRVDEKAYKAALDRIPTPKKPFDPWGQVHESESAKTTNKPN